MEELTKGSTPVLLLNSRWFCFCVQASECIRERKGWKERKKEGDSEEEGEEKGGGGGGRPGREMEGEERRKNGKSCIWESEVELARRRRGSWVTPVLEPHPMAGPDALFRTPRKKGKTKAGSEMDLRPGFSTRNWKGTLLAKIQVCELGLSRGR